MGTRLVGLVVWLRRELFLPREKKQTKHACVIPALQWHKMVLRHHEISNVRLELFFFHFFFISAF